MLRAIEISEMSKLGCLIGLINHAIWADSLHLLYLLVVSVPQILAPSQLTP
jgi:hypothetical protein